MTDSLPRGWATPEIGEILQPLEDGRTIHQGWSPRCEKDPSASDADWGVLKTTAIQAGEYLPGHNKRLPDTLEPRPHLEVKRGDLLLTSAGPRSRCGVACMVKNTRPKLMISGKMYRFRFDAGWVLPEYIEMYLQSHNAWIDIDNMKTGVSDSGLNLTQNRFRRLRIRLAPVAEQRRIVTAIEEHLSHLDAIGASLAQILHRLEAFRTAVLHEIFTTRLRDAPSLERLPLRDLLGHTIGGVWGNAPGEDEQDVDVARVTELRDHGSLSLDTAARRSITNRQLLSRRLEPGDLLLEKSGGGPKQPVGRVARFMGHPRDAVCTNFMQLLRPDKSQIDSAFLTWQLHYRYLSGHTASMNKGSGNIRNLQMETYLTQPILVVPKASQSSICKRIEDSYAVARQVEESTQAALARVESLRRSVLTHAFAGQLARQDPHDEPASMMLERIARSRPARPRRRKAIE